MSKIKGYCVGRDLFLAEFETPVQYFVSIPRPGDYVRLKKKDSDSEYNIKVKDIIHIGSEDSINDAEPMIEIVVSY